MHAPRPSLFHTWLCSLLYLLGRENIRTRAGLVEGGKRNVEESWAIVQATAVPDQTPATNSRTREEPGREQTLPSEPSRSG